MVIASNGLTVSTGTANFGSNLSVTGPVVASGGFISSNGLSVIAGSATFAGMVIASNGLTVSTGTANFGSNLSVTGPVVASGGLTSLNGLVVSSGLASFGSNVFLTNTLAAGALTTAATNNFCKKSFSVTGGPLSSTPTWWKLAQFSSSGPGTYTLGAVRIDGMLTRIGGANTISATIGFHTSSPYIACLLDLKSSDGTTDLFAGGTFDIALYLDFVKSLFIFAKSQSDFLSVSLDVTCTQFEGGGVLVYPNTSYQLAYAARDAQLIAKDSSLTAVSNSYSFYTLTASNKVISKGSNLYCGGLNAGNIISSNGLSVTSGTVSLPASSVGVAAISGLASVATIGSAADLNTGVLATARIPNLSASNINTKTFSVGAFGSTNITTTGTLAAAASTLGTLTCSTITTGNSNINAGTGSIISGQHNPTANATYDLGSSGTAWRSGFFSSNLTVTSAVSTSNLTATGTVSLPASSVGVAAISGLATVATSGLAANLSSGVLAPARIPNLSASNINTGTFMVGAFGSTNINTTGTIAAVTYSGLPRKYWNAWTLGVYNALVGSLYKIATILSIANASGGGSVRISGTLGGFGMNQSASLDCMISSRGAYSVKGKVTGYANNAKGMVDIVTYVESIGAFTIYIKVLGSFVTWDRSVEPAGINVTVLEPSNTNTSAPTGTLNTSSVLSILSYTTETSTNTTSFGNFVFASNATDLTWASSGSASGGSISCGPVSCTNILVSGSVSLPASSLRVSAISGLAAVATSGSAADLNSGVLATARIPNLSASNINTGTFTIGAFGFANISTTGALSCGGTSTNSYTISFDSTTANACRDIVQYTGYVGRASFIVTIVQSIALQTCVKEYAFAGGYNITSGSWQRCIPKSTYNANTDACELQMNSSNAVTKFRLVHSVVNQASSPTITIKAFYSQSHVPALTNLTANAQYTDASSSTYSFLSTTALTTTGGQVGVGMLAPSAKFHVAAGNAQFDCNITVSGSLTCTTISTGNNNVTIGTGSITSGQHNPTTNATYDLGASGTAWRSGFFSSNLTVTSAVSTSNLTATGTVSLPASSVGVAAISGLATVATSGSAADLNSRVLATARIPNLNASNINTETLTVGAFGSTNISTTGTLSAGASTLTSVTTTVGSNNVMPGILAINNSLNGGYARGIRYNLLSDANWAGYMSTAGSGLSLAGGTTCASLDGRTGFQLRNRVANSTTQGLVWENASESCLMSLTADIGNLFVKGMYSASGNGGLMCTALSGGRSLGSFLTTRTLTGNANAPLYWTNIHTLTPLANIFNGITTNYGIRITGYINIQYAQTYTFYFNTQDDTTYVYIDGTLVIGQGSYTGTQTSANYTFSTAGWKPLYIHHSKTGGGELLRLQWSTTGTETIVQQDIPASSLAYNQSEAKSQSLGGPLFYSDSTYNIGIANTNPSHTLDVTGSMRATNGLIVSSNTSHLRSTYGSIGFISYSDGATYYQLATSSGDSGGSFNSLRPFQWNLVNGNVGLANNQVTFAHNSGAMTCTSINASGNLTASDSSSLGDLSAFSVASSGAVSGSTGSFSTSLTVSGTTTFDAPLLPYGGSNDIGRFQDWSIIGTPEDSMLTWNDIHLLGGVRLYGTDPGYFIHVDYLNSDVYGYGQWSGGTARAVISGSNTSATFNISKPTGASTFIDMVTVTHAGNMGLGLSPSSAYKLDIAGKIHATGAVQFDSNLTVSSSLNTSNLTATGTVSLPTVTPSADNTYNLGSAANRWGTVYAKTYYGSTQKYWNKYNLGLVNATTGYQEIATLLGFVGANNSVLRISGQFGGEASFAVIDMYVSSRPSPPISVSGTAYGSLAAAKAYGNVVLYLEADSSYSVYLSTTKQSGSWDLSIEGNSGNILLEPSSTNTAAPTGTLQTPSSLSQLVVTTQTTTDITTFTTGIATKSLALTTSATTNVKNAISAFAPSLGTGQFLLETFGTAQSTNNCAYIGFNNTGGSGSSSNYAGLDCGDLLGNGKLQCMR
jgi:hypothetical protein